MVRRLPSMNVPQASRTRWQLVSCLLLVFLCNAAIAHAAPEAESGSAAPLQRLTDGHYSDLEFLGQIGSWLVGFVGLAVGFFLGAHIFGTYLRPLNWILGGGRAGDLDRNIGAVLFAALFGYMLFFTAVFSLSTGGSVGDGFSEAWSYMTVGTRPVAEVE